MITSDILGLMVAMCDSATTVGIDHRYRYCRYKCLLVQITVKYALTA